MTEITFATAINCIDGRTHLPVIDYIRGQFGVDFVDMVTEPGPNKILSENLDKTTVNSIKDRVRISLERHDSNLIAIVGHHDCAGNPSGEDTQKQQIVSAMNSVKSWNFDVQIIGLWVDKSWCVSEIFSRLV